MRDVLFSHVADITDPFASIYIIGITASFLIDFQYLFHNKIINSYVKEKKRKWAWYLKNCENK